MLKKGRGGEKGEGGQSKSCRKRKEKVTASTAAAYRREKFRKEGSIKSSPIGDACETERKGIREQCGTMQRRKK